MHCQTLQEPSIAGELAQDLLAAWDSRDAYKLSAQLEKTLASTLEVNSSVELERLRLLLAIAQRIRGSDRQFGRAGDNPALDLCRSLLGHLSSHTFPFSPRRPHPVRQNR